MISLQVPVLMYEGHTLKESNLICEFLDEAYSTGNSLMPRSALNRAMARAAFDFCNLRLMPLFYRMLTAHDQRPATAEQLTAVFKELDVMLRESSHEGPFWFGEHFTLVDIVFFPFADRFVC